MDHRHRRTAPVTRRHPPRRRAASASIRDGAARPRSTRPNRARSPGRGRSEPRAGPPGHAPGCAVMGSGALRPGGWR
jgi:hypothetical protein